MNTMAQMMRVSVSKEGNRKVAMTLTPPYAGERAAGSRCVRRTVARRTDCQLKSNE
jgi:hypothetical protein